TGIAIDAGLHAKEIGRAEMVRKGTGIAILNFGVLLDQALAAAKALGATVVDMRWVKPLDEAMILSLVEQHDLLITLEENAVAGGAGSGVAEFLANAGVICQLRHVGIPDAFIAHAGQGECRQLAGLTADNIIAVAQSTAPATTSKQAL
ncbi:MAG: transketolase C-terminal domain-containing protein, partial [Luminiphilus sp.]|nr:transketolase C-terminal domain-containing protein [Luminiphilus sp.]